jgi:hypothetical protein
MSGNSLSHSEGAVSLDAYAYGVARVNGPVGAGLAQVWGEWVLVDQDEVVLEVFPGPALAVDDLNARFDADASLVSRLRLVVLDNGRHAFDAWPRGGSAAERAGALASHMSGAELTDAQVAERTRRHFLRGELGSAHIAGEELRSVELWWYDDGAREPVGVLVERVEELAWQLLLDGRARGLTEWQLHRRVAQVMVALGDERWTEDLVAQVAADVARGRSATERFGPAAVCVEAQLQLARELHIMDPLGRSWP